MCSFEQQHQESPGEVLEAKSDSIEKPSHVECSLSLASSGTTNSPLDCKNHQTVKKSYRYRALVQFLSLCFTLFLAGWNDGTTGPLLPRIQETYHVNYTVVSLLFILLCLGCFLGSITNIFLTQKIGFGKAIVIASIAQLSAYAVQAAAPPFPVFVLVSFINGFGISIQDAQANGFVAALETNAATKMGILQASYGAGGLVAPFLATKFSHIPRWSLHYAVSAGLACVNTTFLVAVFWFKDQDACLAEIGQYPKGEGDQEASHFKQIFRMKSVHLLAIFLLCYVGVEVTIGSWIVTYVIRVRGANTSAGYVASGFFGGLTLGRVALLWLNKKIGEVRAIYLYTLLAIVLELVIWFVPSFVVGAITVSFVGFSFGPIYPIVMNHAGRIFPTWLLTGAIGYLGGVGTIGAAVVPFMTGAIASRTGIQSLQPVSVSMMVVMLVLWICVPKK